MGRKTKTIEELLILADTYGVSQNPIVQELIGKYNEQKRMITEIQKQIKADGLTCKKEYVKGRENLVANPLLDTFQKHQDSSSRTLDSLTDAIIKFGTTPAKKSRLSALIEENH